MSGICSAHQHREPGCPRCEAGPQGRIEIKYQEYDIDLIFREFVKGFELKPGLSIPNFETNYDPRTGKVIFKLYVEGLAKSES